MRRRRRRGRSLFSLPAKIFMGIAAVAIAAALVVSAFGGGGHHKSASAPTSPGLVSVPDAQQSQQQAPSLDATPEDQVIQVIKTAMKLYWSKDPRACDYQYPQRISPGGPYGGMLCRDALPHQPVPLPGTPTGVDVLSLHIDGDTARARAQIRFSESPGKSLFQPVNMIRIHGVWKVKTG